jgi:hypothetical protein
MTEPRPASSNGANHGRGGRFVTGNSARKRHDLRSTSKRELRRINRRTAGLARRLGEALADAGRALEPLALPAVWRWAEAEVRRTDCFAALQVDPTNQKLHEMWASACRIQASVEKELGMTPATGQQLRSAESDPVLQVMRLRAANNDE